MHTEDCAHCGFCAVCWPSVSLSCCSTRNTIKWTVEKYFQRMRTTFKSILLPKQSRAPPFAKVSGKERGISNRVKWNGLKNKCRHKSFGSRAQHKTKLLYSLSFSLSRPVPLRHQQKLKSMVLPILGGVIKPSSTIFIKHADAHTPNQQAGH